MRELIWRMVRVLLVPLLRRVYIHMGVLPTEELEYHNQEMIIVFMLQPQEI